MRREPSLTYRGALAILGRHDRPRIARLDKLLGGVILTAGAVALGGTALAPLAVFAAVWGWVDQKNEAISLLRAALDSATDRLMKTSGYERHQLICAAHTTIVMAAFFEQSRSTSASNSVSRTLTRSVSSRGRSLIITRLCLTCCTPPRSPRHRPREGSRRISMRCGGG
ncbi:hypothetical protein GCM10020216_003500 [Nonomuraea helvata]